MDYKNLLLGNEQSQEEFNQLLQYLYQNNGWGLVGTAPGLGTTSRLKLAVEQLIETLAKPMNPVMNKEGANPTNEWQAALLKYKTVENQRIVLNSQSQFHNFHPCYIDLRSIQTRSEIILIISSALNITELSRFESLQEDFFHLLRSGEVCTLLILDHVNTVAAGHIQELFSSFIDVIGVIVVCDCQISLADLPVPPGPNSAGASGFNLGSPLGNYTERFDENYFCQAFFNEIRKFAMIFNFVFPDGPSDQSNGYDQQRILIYSTTLSFRETFSLVKTLTQMPATPTVPPESDENPQSAVNSGASTPAMIPKTDIILELSKGIPNLIQMMTLVDPKYLKMIQENLFTNRVFSRPTSLSIKKIFNKFQLIGKSFATIFQFYFELFKLLPVILSGDSLRIIMEYSHFFKKIREGKTKDGDDESDDSENSDDEENGSAAEATSAVNKINESHTAAVLSLKYFSHFLIDLGMNETDLLFLQNIQFFVPLWRPTEKEHTMQVLRSLSASTGGTNSRNASKSRSFDQQEIHEIAAEFELLVFPYHIIEMIVYSSINNNSFDNSSIGFVEPVTDLLSSVVLGNPLQHFINLFEELRVLKLFLTIPELQQFSRVNQSLGFIQYQLNELMVLFSQIRQLSFPFSSSQLPLELLLAKKTTFENDLLTRFFSNTIEKQENVKENDSHEDMMLITGLLLLSFGGEITERWFPLEENMYFIIIFSKMIIRKQIKDLSALLDHPFVQSLLSLIASDNKTRDPMQEFALIVLNASEAIFQVWKSYLWSFSWMKPPNDDILFQSINEFLVSSIDKLLLLHSNLMEAVNEKSSKIETARSSSLNFHYFYSLSKKVIISSEFTDIKTFLFSSALKKMPLEQRFQKITQSINENTRKSISQLVLIIETFQKDYKNLSKLQMKIYLQDLIDRFKEEKRKSSRRVNRSHTLSSSQENFGEEAENETEIGEQPESSSAESFGLTTNYAKNVWFLQRILVLKIFESSSTVYLSSANFILSLFFRKFDGFLKCDQILSRSGASFGRKLTRNNSQEQFEERDSVYLESVAGLKDLLPFIYFQNSNFHGSFLDKVQFYRSISQLLKDKRSKEEDETGNRRYYPTDEEYDYSQDAEEEESKQHGQGQEGVNYKETTEVNDSDEYNSEEMSINQKFPTSSDDALLYDEAELKLRNQIKRKQRQFSLLIYYLTKAIEEYSNIYGNNSLLTTKYVVFLSFVYFLEYQNFNYDEKNYLSSYYESLFVDNRSNCDLSLFHYRKLMLSSSASPSSRSTRELPFMYLISHYYNNTNEVKFMYSLLHYLMGQFHLALSQQYYLSKKVSLNNLHTQTQITLALFQTSYQTLLSIPQRNDSATLFLISLIFQTLQLLRKTEKIELFTELMNHLIEFFYYERNYLQERMLLVVKSILVSSFSSTPPSYGKKSVLFSNRIDSNTKSTLLSGLELAFTIHSILAECAKLYERREYFKQASLIHKELLYMYRDLNILLQVDVSAIFFGHDSGSLSGKQPKMNKKGKKRFDSVDTDIIKDEDEAEEQDANEVSEEENGEGEENSSEEEEEERDPKTILKEEFLVKNVNIHVYTELKELLKAFVVSFPSVDRLFADVLFDLGRSYCYYYLDPTILSTSSATQRELGSPRSGEIPSLLRQQSDNVTVTSNSHIFYHQLYENHSLSHYHLPFYYLQQTSSSLTSSTSFPFLQYYQAIRALQKARVLYTNLFIETGQFDTQKQLLARIYLRIYHELGLLYCRKREFAKSLHCYQVIQKLFLSVPSFLSILEIADIQLEYANILMFNNNFFEARIFFQQATDSYRQFYLENLSVLSSEGLREPTEEPVEGQLVDQSEETKKKNKMAEKFINEEEKRLFQFIQKKLILANLGKSSAFLEETGYDNAQEAVEETLSLIFELYQRNDDIYILEVTVCYLILASVLHYYHEYEEALMLYEKIEKIYRQLKMTETVEMASLYHNQAIIQDEMVT
jgi:hypothetical protein